MHIGKPIYQQEVKLPIAQDRTILMSSWVINGMPAGICFREDTNKLTNNNSEFLVHYFSPLEKYKEQILERKFEFKCTEWQKGARVMLYGKSFEPKIYKSRR